MEPNRQRVDQWFALRVKGRSEKTISDILVHKGYTSFLPLYPCGNRRLHEARCNAQPLFPGYVFCRFDVHQRLPVLKTPGVLNIVSIGRAPAALDDREITSLQKAVEHRFVAGPSEFLPVGTRVRIIQGALSGVEGILLEFKNPVQLILSITLLCRSVRVEVPRHSVMAGSAPALRLLRESAILP